MAGITPFPADGIRTRVFMWMGPCIMGRSNGSLAHGETQSPRNGKEGNGGEPYGEKFGSCCAFCTPCLPFSVRFQVILDVFILQVDAVLFISFRGLIDFEILC